MDEGRIDSYLYRQHVLPLRGQRLTGEISSCRYKWGGIVTSKSESEIIAPLVFDATMDHSLFPALPEHAVIVMDNASFHRKKKLHVLARKTHRSLIFLPPYSPELNPIEHFWSWLKRSLRKVLPACLSFDDALFHIFQVN